MEELVKRSPNLPAEVVKSAMDSIIASMRSSLLSGRPVTLRGFGSLLPRQYSSSGAKKFGLLFHPSQILSARINKPKRKKTILD
jgi:nucleoid DNA-binding protein